VTRILFLAAVKAFEPYAFMCCRSLFVQDCIPDRYVIDGILDDGCDLLSSTVSRPVTRQKKRGCPKDKLGIIRCSAGPGATCKLGKYPLAFRFGRLKSCFPARRFMP